jgi:glycerol-3-phosphate dehydrogenase
MGSLSRPENLERLRTTSVWDLIIIGGGATGLGAAVDAASRGHSCLLLEAHDFAQGTSSRSTKLIHGGVRYLAQGNVSLVREALHERGILLRNAPHLVHNREFVIPAYRWTDIPFYGAGLKLYDLLAGSLGVGHANWISASEVIEQIPTLDPHGLRGGIIYTDGQFDDSRLAITLARTAADQGAALLNHTPVTGFLRNGPRIAGVTARDSETGEIFEIRARAVINATGVYVDALRRWDDPQTAADPLVTPSRGSHIVLDRSFLPSSAAVLIPHTDDGRVLFAIPWHDHTLVGTTDTPTATLPIEPQPQLGDTRYLIEHIGRYLVRKPTSADVRSTFAGLRPLLRGGAGKSTAKLSREHAVVVSPSGLVTITGGKWTTYRVMASDAVNYAEQAGQLPRRPCVTRTLALHGSQPPQPGTEESLSVYGSDLPQLMSLLATKPDWEARLHPALPYRVGEIIWSARHEAARTVEDVLARRTRALFLDARAAVEAAPTVARELAKELARDQPWQDAQLAHFRELAKGYIIADD